MKRVTIVGGGGQLGQELTAEFAGRGYDATSLDRSDLDITDMASVQHVLTKLEPAIVVNAAAYNKVDLAEQEPLTAMQVNGLAVRSLALSCASLEAQFVHISTDYVFDGQAGHAYREEDPTHPLSAYAVSKLAGELYTRAYLDRSLILRTSGVYGPLGAKTAHGNFVELMLRLARERKPIRVLEDHVASPTYAPALACRTVDLVEKGATGILHVGGGNPMSWFDWAGRIFAAAGLEPDLKPTNNKEYHTPARRPKYSALSNAKMESLGIPPMPRPEEALEDYFLRRPA